MTEGMTYFINQSYKGRTEKTGMKRIWWGRSRPRLKRQCLKGINPLGILCVPTYSGRSETAQRDHTSQGSESKLGGTGVWQDNICTAHCERQMKGMRRKPKITALFLQQ